MKISDNMKIYYCVKTCLHNETEVIFNNTKYCLLDCPK